MTASGATLAAVAEMTPPAGWFFLARLEGKPAGCGALLRIDETTGEIKRMWTAPFARGRGVATAAASLALTWAFRELGYARVELTTAPDNESLVRLAQRLGFRREGMLRAHNVERGQRVDVVCFGLLREEWQAARGR